MSSSLEIAPSARVLGLIAGAVGVPRKSRTGQRLVAGSWLPPETAVEESAALLADVLDAVLAPEIVDVLRDRLSAVFVDGPLDRESFPRLLGSVARASLQRFDRVVRVALSDPASRERPDAEVAQALLRVAAIDLAVRVGAGCALLGRRVPAAFSSFVNPARRGAPARLARRALRSKSIEAFADELGFARSVVEGWLKGERPALDSLEVLATAVAGKARGHRIANLRRRFRLLYAGWELVERARCWGGDAATMDVVRGVVRTAAAVAHELRTQAPGSSLPAHLLLFGSGSPVARPVLRRLGGSDSDAVWRCALLAVAQDPAAYIQYASDVACAGRENEQFWREQLGWPPSLVKVVRDQQRAYVFTLDEPPTPPQLTARMPASDRAVELGLRAVKLRLFGALEEELKVLKRAVALAPRDSLTLFAYARALHDAGNTKAAVRTLRDIVRMEPDDEGAQMAIGSFQLTENTPEGNVRALEHLRSLQGRIPWSRDYGHALGLAYVRAQLWNEASEIYERSLAEDPDDAKALERAAHCDLSAAGGRGERHDRGVERAKRAYMFGYPGTYVAWRGRRYRSAQRGRV
jgi:hypothetical protein